MRPIRTLMKEKYKKSDYPSKNVKTETYVEGDVFVTKLYHDEKDGYVKELSNLKDGVKEVKHFTVKGVLSKLEYFVNDRRHGVETKYFIPKANKSVKSTKTYADGKLHGECVTYNDNDEVIKQELYAEGKLALKYARNDSHEIRSVQIVDKDGIAKLPEAEREKLRREMENNPDWFADS